MYEKHVQLFMKKTQGVAQIFNSFLVHENSNAIPQISSSTLFIWQSLKPSQSPDASIQNPVDPHGTSSS